MRLRPYKPADAENIVTWVEEYSTFIKWCAGKMKFPLTVQRLNDYIAAYESDDRAWCFTMIDDTGLPVGTMTMLFADYENGSVHFGFVAVDPVKRNQGFGKQLMTLALRYAFEILQVNKATLKVFDNNPGAKACYEAVGFKEVTYYEKAFPVGEERWGYYDMAAYRKKYGEYQRKVNG